MSKRLKQAIGLTIYEPIKVEFASLNFAEYNPRIISKEMMRSLERSVEEHGVPRAVVVQKTGMTLIAGHQMIRATKSICKRNRWQEPTHIWAYVLDVDDRTAKRMNIALNRIEGQFDASKLGQLLKDVNDVNPIGDLDALGMGFDLGQIGELLKSVGDTGNSDLPQQSPEKLPTFAKSITLSIEFDTAAERDATRDKLAEMIRGKQIKSGSIVAGALNITTPKVT